MTNIDETYPKSLIDDAINPETAFVGSTGALALPAGTTAQRPSPVLDGALRYNETLEQFEGYVNGSWNPISDIEYIFQNFTSFFATDTTTRDLGYSIFGYVDPRWYGAFCGANFASNNNIQDDSLGIQAALNTGRNVRLPAGVKLANRVRFMADGQTIFYEGTGSRYNSNYPGQAYVFLPNDLWRGGSSPSTTSLALSVGSKSLTVNTGLPWVNGMSVIIWNASNRWMQGTVTSYDSGTGALVANITDVVGSGTFTSWDVDQSLNCAVDSNGYDNVALTNIAFRANFASVGATAVGNSGPVSGGGAPGIRGPRGAAFINITNCSFLNLGNGIGAALESFFQYRGTSTTPLTIGTGTKNLTTQAGLAFTPGREIGVYNTNSNYMNGTVTSYDAATGALVVDVTSVGGSGTFTSWTVDSLFGMPITTGAKSVIHNNVYQLRVSGADFIGDIWGHLANSTDVHMDNIYTANCAHSGLSSLLTGYGLTGEIMNARVEYCGFGVGPPGNKKFPTGGACIYYAAQAYLNISCISGDHNYGPTVKAQSVGGRRAQNLTLTGVASLGSFYQANAGADNAHFVFDGVDGLTATGITTNRNGVDTAYVVQFSGSNNFVNWSGAGGAQGSGAAVGQWGTAYFNFITTPVNFSYNVPGVGAKVFGLADEIVVAASDITSDLTTGANKAVFRMPYAFRLTGLKASVATAPTGASLLTVDVNKNGTTILPTKLTFDATEKTTVTAATPYTFTGGATFIDFANDDEVTIDIDTIGSTLPGKGLVVTLLGYKA